MAVRSWRGITLGAFIALVVPASYWVMAMLVENGMARIDRTGSVMGTLTSIALSEVVLGPLGILIAGRSAGLRHVITWLVLIVVGLPLLAVVWFVGVATLSGALGSPF